MTTESFRFEMGLPPTKPWSINEERTKHWSWRSSRVETWRHAASILARKQGLAGWVSGRHADVEFHLPFDRGGRRDPSNWLPACKAGIDGLVDAGVWFDDGPDMVTVIEPVLYVGKDLFVVLTCERRP